MTYKPFIFKLNNLDVSTIYDSTDVIKSSNINQPLFSLGFHSFIHRTKSAMAITEKLETKNKFYYVVNPFEQSINDYKEDIEHMSDTFLNNPQILSRAFYKMWEMLYIFDIGKSNNKESMTMVGLAEGPGSFIQAFVEFREKYYDPSKDTVYGLTINSNNTAHINKEMVENINKRYDNMISVLKTNSKQTKTKSLVSNGDLTKPETIEFLKENVKQKADLVTADGGFEWKNENYQEQEAYTLILGEIIGALSIQAKGGSFVLKVFETFTHTTIKLIYLLSSFYEETYLYKPFFSRSTNSEKYIICKGFKYNDVEQSKMKKLLDCLKKCETKEFINDIFPKFILSNEDVNIFKYININIANTQQIMINNLIVYIKSNNYFGDSYHNYRDLQMKANKWWISNFFTEKLNEKSTLVKDIIRYNESEINLFVKKLV
uniref:Ribosomal RNA methyltransferase FtsJ domain-containing protein n=1 Tax=viral metagenome TaxID=1070528 RepID=A0A6C0HW15_9ZZZZ